MNNWIINSQWNPRADFTHFKLPYIVDNDDDSITIVVIARSSNETCIVLTARDIYKHSAEIYDRDETWPIASCSMRCCRPAITNISFQSPNPCVMAACYECISKIFTCISKGNITIIDDYIAIGKLSIVYRKVRCRWQPDKPLDKLYATAIINACVNYHHPTWLLLKNAAELPIELINYIMILYLSL